jgi:hypothetical protein
MNETNVPEKLPFGNFLYKNFCVLDFWIFASVPIMEA